MAEENAWNDAIEPEETPVDALVETPEEPIAGEGTEGEEGLQEVLEEEDPEAWRNIHIPEDAGAIHRLLTEIAEKSPAAKRALASASSLKLQREMAEREQELQERLEVMERRSKVADKLEGDNFWGRMNEAQLGQYLKQNPQHTPFYQRWNQVTQELAQPQQNQSLRPTRNLLNDANDIVNQYAPQLPEEVEVRLREMLKDREFLSQYKDRSHMLVLDLKETIDNIISGGNNGAVQTDATPRVPAPVTSGQARNESRVQASPVNPNIGKFAPDASKRAVPSGGGKPITRAELESYDEDQYAGLLKRHGAKTGQELYRRGIIVD